MKATIKLNLTNIAVLLPFVLIFLGAIFLKVYHPVGTFLKFSAFIYMLLYTIFYKRKISKNLGISLLLFLPFFIYGILHTYNINAGIEDGLRYMFPVAALLYGYAIKEHFPLVLKFVIFYLIISVIAQFSNYFFWLQGVKQWFYSVDRGGNWFFNQALGVIRATGLVVYFANMGFIAMISYFLIKRYYFGTHKKLLLGISLFLLFASISFKTIVSFFIVLLLLNYKRIVNVLSAFLVGLILLILVFPTQLRDFVDSFMIRINAYLFMKTPTLRVNSYIAMFKEIIKPNWFGQGVGSFGGPASIKYNSPYYEAINFTWPDTFWMKLTTVDTFPPHVFVELGIIGGSLFFLLIISPIFRRYVPVMVLIIYFTLFADMLFTFSLSSFEYLMYSLVLVYPIIYYEQQLNKKNTMEETD